MFQRYAEKIAALNFSVSSAIENQIKVQVFYQYWHIKESEKVSHNVFWIF